MKYLEGLGDCPLGIGCWALGDAKMWGSQDEKEGADAIHAALDAGVRFFDTAPAYGGGASEEFLGRALAGRREEAVIATKVSRADLAPRELRRSCEASLRRLGTETIDLLQVHWPSREVPLGETVEEFARLREEGKIRSYGVCNFGPKDLGDWLKEGGAKTTDQLCYSLLARGIEKEIVPLLLENGMGVIAYSPLLQGLLTGKFSTPEEVPPERARSRHFSGDRPMARHGEGGCEELTFTTIDRLRKCADAYGHEMGAMALAWLMRQPAVNIVLVGVRSRQQLERNRQALSIRLDEEQLHELDEVTRPLRDFLGSEGDIWGSPSRMR